MSRFLTEEQLEIQEATRTFARKEIRPRRLEAYDGHEFITEISRRCGELGMWRTLVPEARGGLGQGATTACIIFEELGRESPGVAIAGIPQMVFAPVMLLSDAISDRYLEGVISGELMIAGAFSDPAGVANYAEQSDIAVRDGDDYILNGTRLWVTQGTFYDVMGIAGLYEGSQRLFYVERGHPGVSVSPIPKMGFGAPWGLVTMNNCRVPAESSVDLSFMVTDRQIQDVDGNATASVLYASAITLGLAHSAWDQTVGYLTSRTINRRPIASMQAIQHKLVRLRSEIEASRSLLYDAARLRDEDRPDSALEHMVKPWVTEMATAVTQECITLHGGTGYASETGLEGLHRDAVGGLIIEGTTDMHHSTVAHLLGLPDAAIGIF
jgi:alkylation response protein AidB-like acyl-CoA dehydrogenase